MYLKKRNHHTPKLRSDITTVFPQSLWEQPFLQPMQKLKMILPQHSHKLFGNGFQTAVPKKLLGTVYFDKSCGVNVVMV